MGFFCEADGDTAIRLDKSELAEARWCPRAEVPEWEDVSLTMEMMQVFRTKGILEFNRGTSGDTSSGVRPVCLRNSLREFRSWKIHIPDRCP